MIKLEALESFRLQRFNDVKNLVRAGREEKGFINKNDTFECEKDLADYLLGANPLEKPVVRVIEVKPEVVIEKEEAEEVVAKEKPKKKKTSKK